MSQITLTTVEDLDALVRSIDPASERVASVHLGGHTAASYQLDAAGVGLELFKARLQSITAGLLSKLPAGSRIYTGSEEAVEFLRIIDVHLPTAAIPGVPVANAATA